MATVQDSVVGMMALDGDELEQLYIDPAWQRHGFGAAECIDGRRNEERERTSASVTTGPDLK
ncbi:hypothetical protein GCM10023148_10240 [Actinokineospora soli]